VDSHAIGSRTVARSYLYLSPLIVTLGLFTYWPLLQTFYLSFVRFNPDTWPTAVGFDNYAGVFGNAQFRDASRNSLVYIVAAVPLQVLLPIPVACFLWTMPPRMADLHKTILFDPALLSFVVVAIVWIWMLNPVAGFLQTILEPLGIKMPALLSNADTAIFVIIGVSMWKILGFNALLYLAGLAVINRDLIDAMRVDGAGDGTIFRRLIVPLLSPTIFFVLISSVVFAIQHVFTPIDVMTRGGPASATTNLFYIAYQYTFESFNIGFASAAVTLLFGLIGGLILLQLGVIERYVHYR
jgi:ABC-type sugar transport system permease subunit